jgi:Raf kinase inhibitor-like YbhB/YbcL family protein
MMELTSSAFQHEGAIPSKYTCDGDNVNPPLAIFGVPDQAQSLVLIMDDPDVPVHLRPDGMWDHWVVFNIPTSTAVISEGQEPPGMHGVGTAGNTAYHGPCPPDREHRYFFKLYALDTELALFEGVGKRDVEQTMEGHILEETVLMGRYERRK